MPEPAASEYIIETENLSKHYGAQRALEQVSLRLRPGTIGLLGPNGAGKSTFIKCLLNLETPTAGAARVLGRDIRLAGRASRERIGHSPERDSHVAGLAGCEYVTYCGQLAGMPYRAARQRAHEILDLVGMGEERYRKVDGYSTGMRQRVKLAQALVHDPEIVFLDEPTNGLDPSGREHILELIGSLQRELGTSVIMSSHLLRDIERVCDHVVIIARGRVIENQSLEVLRTRNLRVVELRPAQDLARYAAVLQGAGIAVAASSNGRLRLESAAPDVNWLLALMAQHRLPPAEIVRDPNALHELFIAAVGEEHAGLA